MLPGKFSLQLYRGDSAAYQFIIWSDRQGVSPLNLGGAVALAEIRDAPGGTLLATMNTIITAPNIVQVSLTPGQTLILPHKAVWDLQLSFGTGEVISPIGGGVAVQDDVSASLPAPPPTPGPVPLPDPPPAVEPRTGIPRSDWVPPSDPSPPPELPPRL